MLDLDGTGGKTFLRVLLHLGMHDYPPLVSGALRLLFRHFSQRQEVLQAFKQVSGEDFVVSHDLSQKTYEKERLFMHVSYNCNRRSVLPTFPFSKRLDEI